MIKKHRKTELRIMIQDRLRNMIFPEVFDEDIEELKYLNMKLKDLEVELWKE